MTFFQFEIDYLKKSFPFEKAYLTEDLDEKELQTVDELGILKHAPHLYLDSRLRFNTNLDGKVRTAKITIYGKQDEIIEIIDQIFDTIVPTCRILIDAWFISESKPYDSDEHHLRVIYPNNSGALNKTQIISDEDDLNLLKNEFRNNSLHELLIRSHDLNRKEKSQIIL